MSIGNCDAVVKNDLSVLFFVIANLHNILRLPGLKSQSKSALNSAVSEISKISALISAVSEWVNKTSADQRCFRAVQRWIKTKWEIDEKASCKFETVLGSRKTCSFGVYQLWKKSFRRNSSQKFELTHPPLPHASWSHMPCRIVKRLKYRVLSKKWTENKAKDVLISVFLLFQTKMWRILTSAEQRWIIGKQPCTALKQRWTASIISKSVRYKVSWRKLLRKVQVLSKRNKI